MLYPSITSLVIELLPELLELLEQVLYKKNKTYHLPSSAVHL